MTALPGLAVPLAPGALQHLSMLTKLTALTSLRVWVCEGVSVVELDELLSFAPGDWEAEPSRDLKGACEPHDAEQLVVGDEAMQLCP